MSMLDAIVVLSFLNRGDINRAHYYVSNGNICGISFTSMNGCKR